jgi:hypothetical protein
VVEGLGCWSIGFELELSQQKISYVNLNSRLEIWSKLLKTSYGNLQFSWNHGSLWCAEFFWTPNTEPCKKPRIMHNRYIKCSSSFWTKVCAVKTSKFNRQVYFTAHLCGWLSHHTTLGKFIFAMYEAVCQEYSCQNSTNKAFAEVYSIKHSTKKDTW